ncbi:MAG TPA: hypothetical protein VNU68_33685 [Verrucomicrobiae bacterium]|nr:hypothetical protein [Verrucomicrobiae bacterium]
MNLKALAELKLRGNDLDILGLVEDLFAYARQNRFVAGREQENVAVLFDLADGTTLTIPVDGAMGKFRMMCARLCKLSNDENPALANIYRGFCTMPYHPGAIRIERENTLDNHYFVLRYEEANNADAPNAAIALRVHSDHRGRGVGEP